MKQLGSGLYAPSNLGQISRGTVGRDILFDGSVGPWNEVDTNGKVAIADGVITFTGDGGNNYGDPEIVSASSYARVTGYVLDFDITPDSINQGLGSGLWAVGSGLAPVTADDHAHLMWWFASGQLYCREANTEDFQFTYSATTYYVRILLKATGAEYYVDTVEANRGSNQIADLSVSSDDPLYIGFTSFSNTGWVISNIIYGEAT